MIRLASKKPDWVLGYLDEVWWSRFAQPRVSSWTADKRLKMVEREALREDTEPKAIACYGLLRKDRGEVKVRFLADRPISAITIEFLKWIVARVRKGRQEGVVAGLG